MNNTQSFPKIDGTATSNAPRSWLSNGLILLASAGLVVWSLRLLHERLTSVTSRDAVINGALIDINTPIEGEITDLPIATGRVVELGQALFTLKNERISQLPVQQIESQIRDREAELAREHRRLSQLQSLYQEASLDQANQYSLENQQASDEVAQAAYDLQAIQSRYELANITHQRMTQLHSAGAVSQAEYDKAALEKQQYANEVNGLKARLQAEKAKQASAKQSLTVSGSRGNYDFKLRRRDLETQIIDQEKVIDGINRSLQNVKAELAKARQDLSQRKQAKITASVSGVVYSINARRGQYVQQGALLGKTLDCARRWVDVFVDERELQRLKPGTPANIELYGNEARVLTGKVSFIRSGLGRLAAGQDVAVPIPENLPRMTQVRVDLESNSDRGSSDTLCYVGYTGKVSFQLQ